MEFVLIQVASFPGLLTSAFVACSTRVSTASDKHWGEKAWEGGYHTGARNKGMIVLNV